MKIGIMSAGGIGGYFGARLALAGHDVAFVARGRHLAALRETGLLLRTMGEEIRLDPVTATADPGEIGPVDYLLFAVKLWDTDTAARQARPMVGRATTVLTLQNGIDGLARLEEIFGRERVMGGAALVSSHIAAPGVIEHVGTLRKIVFGEADGRISDRAEQFAGLAEEAGFEAEVSGRAIPVLWEKFIYLSALSAVTCATRQPVGGVRGNPDCRALFEAAVSEAAALARARRIAILPDTETRTLAFFDGLPGEMKSSMQVDLEHGRRLELPWLSGAVVRLGREAGIATPVHETLARALAPYRDGAPPAPAGSGREV